MGHKWIDVPTQYAICKAIYAVFAVWTALYFLCSFGVVSTSSMIFEAMMCLPWLNCLLAAVLLMGMVSVFNKNVKIAMFNLVFNFVLIAIWPRLLVPILAAFLPCFILHTLILVVFYENVVDWPKF